MKQNSRVLALIVGGVAAAVYANSLMNGFALDDNFIVAGNPRVHSPSSLADIWLTPYWTFAGAELGLYRPGIIFLYAIQWAVGGGAPWLFHATNVVLHIAVSIVVFFMLARMVDQVPALLGALIFAVHPVHTEAVSNIVGQAELVAALAVLVACLIHIRRPPGVAVPWSARILIALLFVCALTTKESAVVLPALLVAVDFVTRRVRLTARGFAEYAEAMLLPVFLLTCVLVLYLTFRFEALGGTLIGLDAGPSMPYLREEFRVLNALRAFPEFIRLLILPFDLAADYSPAALLPVDTIRPMVVLGAVLLAVLAILALLTPWMPLIGFPAAWFLISIVTVSNLFFPIGVVIAERTLYLPSVAVAALAAFAFHAALPHALHSARRVAFAAAAIVIVAFGVRTWIRNPVWESTEAVWSSMRRDQPESYRTQWLYAIQLWRAGRIDDAAARFEFAYRIYPRDSQLLTEYGNFHVAQGRFAQAVPFLERAHEAHPWILRTTVILMHAYLGDGRYDDAIRAAATARRDGASDAVSLPVRAYAHQQIGNLPDAIAAWRLAVAASPDAWRLRAFLARAEAAASLDSAALVSVAAARAAATADSVQAQDSTPVDILHSLESGIRSGCYAEVFDNAVFPIPPERPLGVECDQLGHWFEYIVAGQNAMPLQNATAGVPIPAPSGPGLTP